MLVYPRTHRPAGIIVENVDEVDAESTIVASLMSLPGYDWAILKLSAREYGDMARTRFYAVGWR